jgi:hypothetical protein
MKITKLLYTCVALATVAQAHFTFILPLPGDEAAEMILGETLSSRDTVNPALAAGAQLYLRNSHGTVTNLKMEQDGHRFVLALPGTGDRVVYGSANLGVASRGKDTTPHLLLYYPKTILGNAFTPATIIGGDQVVEMTPQGKPGHMSLRLLVRGEPLAGAEITVLLPDGQQQKAKTDASGVAGPFHQHGRYGAWARFWENKTGEQAGKRYEQTRHYAMLVFDSLAQPEAVTSLPEKTSSFGAAVEGDWLYVYGGHIAQTHSYSQASVSGQFSRRKLAGGDWERLPAATPLQGLNLAAHAGKVCRVGGMQPRNAQGQKADNHSVDEVACFEGTSGAWAAWPALPVPRSSHDVAVVGHQLIVTGGWTLRGAEPSLWAKTTLLLDLHNPSAGWREVAQPYERRALVTAVWNGRVYVIGGITPSGKVSTEVDVYDPVTNVWTKGPALPGDAMSGFAPAAAVLQDKLYASTGDGSLFVLNAAGEPWQRVGRSAQRLAHRMVPAAGALLILGGAVKGGNLDLTERLAVR